MASPVRMTGGALAIVLLASACTSKSPSTAGPATRPVPSGSATPLQTTTAGITPAADNAAVDRSTPTAVFKHWLRLVLQGDYRAACLDNGHGGATPFALSPAQCASSMAVANIDRIDGSLHNSLNLMGVTVQTPVAVADEHLSGNSATISDTDLLFGGATWKSILLAHSSIPQGDSFAMSFSLTRIAGSWYITDINLSIDVPTLMNTTVPVK